MYNSFNSSVRTIGLTIDNHYSHSQQQIEMPTIEIDLTGEEDIDWKSLVGKFYLVSSSEKSVYFIYFCAVG